MITKAEIKNAIAECQGESHPDANTCIKLAAYYTILNNMDYTPHSYSSEPVKTSNVISDSEFFDAIRGVAPSDVIVVMGELMDGVRTMIPQLYSATIERLKKL